LAYGIPVLFGVVSLVFLIFNLSPSDPARSIAGQNDSEEVLAAIRTKLGLDLSPGKRYLLWMNDLSPISIHSENIDSRIFFSREEYAGFRVFGKENGKGLYVKAPYLRRSYKSDRQVAQILFSALPSTALLALAALAIALAFGIPAGILAATRLNSLTDRILVLSSVIGMSGPSFFMAILVAWLGGLAWSQSFPLPVLPLVVLVALLMVRKFVFQKNKQLKWLSIPFVSLLTIGLWGLSTLLGFAPVLHLPGTGLPMNGSLYDVNVQTGPYLALQHMILPAITLGIRPLAVVVQMTRGSVLEVLKADYMRTARAKGLNENKILWRHALRNALNPVVTAISGWFASMLAGAVFVEFVFGWKGLGLEIFRALEREDLPVVMGAVLLISAIFVVINILVDVLYSVIDPRVRV